MAKETNKERVSPELRAWLDRVIVPALVREFLAEHKELASGAPLVAESAPTRTAIVEEGE